MDGLFRLTSQAVSLHSPEQEQPVRVITVPKTMKARRVIAIEPSYVMYIQQALWKSIRDETEGDDILSNFIGFTDQTPNQRMAREGSINGTLATLDLSEASDRVSIQHVENLLRNHPHLREAAFAARSTHADVLGRVIKLHKFASMGSALTFPLEAMIFLVIVFVGIERALNSPLTKRSINSFIGHVKIFGDDIVVPNEFAASVASELEAFGLKVNANKSFWSGNFRESCGKEYWRGYDVSVVRLRRPLPTQQKHAAEWVSLVAFRNLLYQAGYRDLESLDSKILRFKRTPYISSLTSAVIGLLSDEPIKVRRMHPDYQVPLIKGPVISAKSPSSKLDGYPALLKCLLMEGDPMDHPPDHLERAGRPRSIILKTRWATPY